MRSKKLINQALLLLLLSFSTCVAADSKYYCTYLSTFRLGKGYEIKKIEEYGPKECKKGDLASIYVDDLDGREQEARYLTYEISELCDIDSQITIINSKQAICSYRGSRRLKRPVSSIYNIHNKK